jgi:phenylacetate-coenzyme A ligase PaaK-like adenylate-forming protein
MIQTRLTGNFDVDRQRHVQVYADRAPAEAEKCTWPLERLHALRDERLRALVRVAKERSPWHSRRLGHIDPETLSGDDLTPISPMTKADLMANWDEIVTDRRLNLELANAHLNRVAVAGPSYLFGDYLIIASGGSTGVRGVFAYDFEGALQVPLGLVRHRRWLADHGITPAFRRNAMVMAGRGTHASIAFGATFAGSSAGSRPFPVTWPIGEIVAGLNEYQPESLGGYPSALHRLALEAQAGRLRIAPQLLSASGEALLPEARHVIEDTFGAPIMNQYSSSEHTAMAMSYPGSRDLHLIEDQAVYEPVDRNWKPVPPGQPAAMVLVTNVVNQLLPLIRYALTDEVTFVETPNPDPWTGRQIAPVPGRLDDVFEYAGGVEVPPHVFRSTLSRLPSICEYQVRQTARGAEILVRLEGRLDLASVHEELSDALARIGLPDPVVTIEPVDHLARLDGTGKLKRFVPLTKGG